MNKHEEELDSTAGTVYSSASFERFLIRFFKHQFLRVLQPGLASHQFDLITVDPDKPNTIFALKTENEVFAGPKHSGGFDHSSVVKPEL
jgi:hypothetical protein